VPRGGRQPNHREYDRLTVRVPVALSTATGQADGETIDLSLTGCSVRTEAPFTAGTTVQARLRLGQVGDVQVDAALVRSHGEGSLGLHFEQMSRSDRERLSRYLGRFLRPSGRPRARSGVPRPEILLAAALGIVLIFMVLMLIGRVGGPPLH
jgi:hypothetical protein